MKTFKFSLVLRTRENTDVFISLDDNIYGIHSKRISILYILEFYDGVKGSSWAEVGGVHEKYVNKKIVKNINFSEKALSLWIVYRPPTLFMCIADSICI